MKQHFNICELNVNMRINEKKTQSNKQTDFIWIVERLCAYSDKTLL